MVRSCRRWSEQLGADAHHQNEFSRTFCFYLETDHKTFWTSPLEGFLVTPNWKGLNTEHPQKSISLIWPRNTSGSVDGSIESISNRVTLDSRVKSDWKDLYEGPILTGHSTTEQTHGHLFSFVWNRKSYQVTAWTCQCHRIWCYFPSQSNMDKKMCSWSLSHNQQNQSDSCPSLYLFLLEVSFCKKEVLPTDSPSLALRGASKHLASQNLYLTISQLKHLLWWTGRIFKKKWNH